MVPRLSSLLLLAAAGFIAAPAAADVVVLQPVRDNTLFEDADGDTSNGAGPAFYAGVNSQGRIRRAVLAFDLRGIPAGVTIESVTLALQVSSAPDTHTRHFTLHRVLADWGEGASSTAGGGGAPATDGDATWLCAFHPAVPWSRPGGDFELAPSGSTPAGDVGAYEWSGPGMVADVQSWVDQPGGNFGWLIQGDVNDFRTVRRFDSREADVPSDRPTLTIHYSIEVATRSVTWGAFKSRYLSR